MGSYYKLKGFRTSGKTLTIYLKKPRERALEFYKKVKEKKPNLTDDQLWELIKKK
jgi:hypothetical protein